MIDFCLTERQDCARKQNQCLYCHNIIDYSVYEYGTGHTEKCLVRDNWVDEDFARWSEYHLDKNGIGPEHCKNCGCCLMTTYCTCHLK